MFKITRNKLVETIRKQVGVERCEKWMEFSQKNTKTPKKTSHSVQNYCKITKHWEIGIEFVIEIVLFVLSFQSEEQESQKPLMFFTEHNKKISR